MTANILLHVDLKKRNDSRACRSPHECVIRNTGPLAYTSAVGGATQALGCTNKIRLPTMAQCADSSSELLRKLHLCSNDAGNIWNSWSCGVARHFDCRNSAARRFACSGRKHYSKTRTFFLLD